MIQKITSFCLLTFLSFSLFAQSPGFERNYRLQDEIEHLTIDGIATNDGGYICLSLVTDVDSFEYTSINLVKLDKKGSIDWSRDYVVEDSLELMKEGDLTSLSEGRLGVAVSLDRDSISQIVFVTDGNGNIEWGRQYGLIDSLEGDARFTPRLEEYVDTMDIATIYQAGSGIIDSVNTNYISALNSQGDVQWAHQIAKVVDDTIYRNIHIGDFTLSHEGGMAIVGVDEDSMQFYISRVDDSGLLMWNQQIYNPNLSPSDGVATGIVQLPDSSYVISGKLFTDGIEYDGFLVKTDSTGITQWSRKIDYDFDIRDIHLNDVVVGTDSSIMVSARQIGDVDTLAIAVKFDFAGNVIWQSKFKNVSTTNVDLGGLDPALGGSGMAFFTTGGSATGNEEFIPILIVADSLGMTMCSDTITEQIVTDNGFVSDTLELVVMPYDVSDTISITSRPFTEFDVPIVVLDPGVYCSNEDWTHELDAFQEDAISYLWTDGEDELGTADTLVVDEEGMYDVMVTMGGSYCFILCDTVQVEEYNLPELVLFPSEPLFCSQGLMTVTAGAQAEAGVDSIVWSTGETGFSIDVASPGTYSATLTDNCGLTVEASVDVVFPILISGISLVGNENSLCDIGFYSIDVIIDPPEAVPSSITWSTGSNMNETTTTFDINSGTYSVTVLDYCNNEFVQSITFEDLPTLAPTTGELIGECFDEQLQLTLIADVDASHTIEWSTGNTGETQILANYGQDSYSVSITDFCGNVEVLEYVIPDNFPSFEGKFSCQEDGIQLFIEGETDLIRQYIWSTNETTSTILAEFEGEGYSVILFDQCLNRDTVTWDKLPRCIPLQFPDVFIPNHRDRDEDNVNAIFAPYVESPEGITNYQLEIYNRWGEKVYESVDFNEGWDGIYKDEVQPGDVYVYYSTFDIFGRTESLQGSLTLLR